MRPPPVTRADLLNHPAFAALELGADTGGNPCVWLNLYECPACDTAWEDQWSCQPDDECPDCGEACSPFASTWSGPTTPELIALWEGLPDAGSPEGDAATAAAIGTQSATAVTNPG